MFLDKLKKEIESWHEDPSEFIKIPILKKSFSRSTVYSLVHEVKDLLTRLSIGQHKRPTIGFYFEDPPNHVIVNIAGQLSNIIAVPIPLEFTPVQIFSFAPYLDFILCDSEKGANFFSDSFGAKIHFDLKGTSSILVLKGKHTSSWQALDLPDEAVSVIHTSGSSDQPKGVVIARKGFDAVIQSMLSRVRPMNGVHYASILPYSLLLEQILGIFLPLFTKGSIALLPKSINCYTGTQQSLDPYLATVKESQANFAMFPPSFLMYLQKNMEKSASNIQDHLGRSLNVVATGGAPIDLSCLEFFSRHGMDVYQGYGLSENTSVVCWNYPGPNRLGSVGHPLDHNNIRLNVQGQIEVSGASVFLAWIPMLVF